MADSPNTTQNPPLTVEAFHADRMAFWGSFTSGTTYAVIALIVLLLVLWVFVV
jgi:hypothetical protein